jgi:hypothetical protein
MRLASLLLLLQAPISEATAQQLLRELQRARQDKETESSIPSHGQPREEQAGKGGKQREEPAWREEDRPRGGKAGKGHHTREAYPKRPRQETSPPPVLSQPISLWEGGNGRPSNVTPNPEWEERLRQTVKAEMEDGLRDAGIELLFPLEFFE